MRGIGLGLLALTAGARTAAADPASTAVAPNYQLLTQLPACGSKFALTIDDGTTSEVVAAYAKFAVDNDIRLTFFPNGVYRSWSDNIALIRPLVESGQIQIGNHTWSHPNLTTISHTEVADQIQRNDKFIKDTFGVSARPYFRPPYGSHNALTDQIAADLGYTTITLWTETVGDSRIITADDVAAAAAGAFKARNIVLGHANQPAVMGAYPHMLELIRSRQLQTVTLDDVFGPSTSTVTPQPTEPSDQ